MNAAIILAGGAGTRMKSSVPKQFMKVKDKMLITYAVEIFAKHPQIDIIIIAAEEKWQLEILQEIGLLEPYERKVKAFAEPGNTRQVSIFNALRVIEKYWNRQVENVLIHDAARPNLTRSLITECLEALCRYEGVMPVLPMKDTIYMSKDEKTVTKLLDRNMLFAGQTPEGFHFEKYLAANKRLLPDRINSINGSTEAAVLAGMDVVMIAGDEYNYKITTSADLEQFKEELLKRKCN